MASAQQPSLTGRNAGHHHQHEDPSRPATPEKSAEEHIIPAKRGGDRPLQHETSVTPPSSAHMPYPDAPHGSEATPRGPKPQRSTAGTGVLFLIVGPSGVGKDTLLDGARERLGSDPSFVFAQRVITRPRDAGGERHEPMSPADFCAAEADGAFAIAWRAHGLAYGIRKSVLDALQNGRNVLVNASRQQIGAFVHAWPDTVVLSVTAPPEIVAARLSARGREDRAAVAARLARAVPIRDAPKVVQIANDAGIEEGVSRLIEVIRSATN
ncbi:MAG: phosphonate metabolism protein/1,5-bisphosphokinase (PRPP-forming) PhnN [Pseudomonadota bacterium]